MNFVVKLKFWQGSTATVTAYLVFSINSPKNKKNLRVQFICDNNIPFIIYRAVKHWCLFPHCHIIFRSSRLLMIKVVWMWADVSFFTSLRKICKNFPMKRLKDLLCVWSIYLVVLPEGEKYWATYLVQRQSMAEWKKRKRPEAKKMEFVHVSNIDFLCHVKLYSDG